MNKNESNLDFDNLFETCYPGLLFYATQFLDEEEAKDVVQDVFFELWKRRDTIVVGDQIKSYLYRLVYTHSINIINHKKVEAKYSDAVSELYNYKMQFYNSENNNEIIRKIANQELNDELKSAINSLPDKCREVFKLSYLHELKNKEIADIMNISLRTVEAHMYKALKLLRGSLKHLQMFFIFFL